LWDGVSVVSSLVYLFYFIEIVNVIDEQGSPDQVFVKSLDTLVSSVTNPKLQRLPRGSMTDPPGSVVTPSTGQLFNIGVSSSALSRRQQQTLAYAAMGSAAQSTTAVQTPPTAAHFIPPPGSLGGFATHGFSGCPIASSARSAKVYESMVQDLSMAVAASLGVENMEQDLEPIDFSKVLNPPTLSNLPRMIGSSCLISYFTMSSDTLWCNLDNT